MIQKFKNTLLVVVTMLSVALPALLPSAVSYAACSSIGNAIGEGANAAANAGKNLCSDAAGTTSADVGAIASQIVNIFSIVVGAISVIMIIYGGFRYITSGGDSGRVGNAKNTLIYAVIGLIIVVLAQLIVHFVINFSSTNVQQ